MKKDTLTFERKLYTAPVCKMHVLELDGTLLADSNTSDDFGEENDDIFG